MNGHKMVNSGLNGFLAVLTLLQHLITSNHLHFMISTQHSSSSVRHHHLKNIDVNKMTLNDQKSSRVKAGVIGTTTDQPSCLSPNFQKSTILDPPDPKRFIISQDRPRLTRYVPWTSDSKKVIT